MKTLMAAACVALLIAGSHLVYFMASRAASLESAAYCVITITDGELIHPGMMQRYGEVPAEIFLEGEIYSVPSEGGQKVPCKWLHRSKSV